MNNTENNFAERTAVITGGISGIGKATAELLYSMGTQLVLLDFNNELGNRVAEEMGDRATFMSLDVADPQAVADVFAAIAERHSSIDILVNCAGISTTQRPVADYPIEDWQRAININLSGSFYAMKYAIPLMSNGDAAIVNLSSIMGQVANPNGAAYAAGKHGVIGLTKAAAQDYGRKGIRVNAIGPGVIETPMTQAAMQDEAVIAAMNGATPIGRFGQADEVAQLIVFLCSAQASFITGAYYPIDGGFLSQ